VIFDFRAIAGVIFRPFLFLLYFLSGYAPRDRNKIVFGSWSGYRYADNTAALFEYMLANGDPRLELVWISRDRRIVDRLRRQGVTAYRAWSLAGLGACLRAGIYVFDGLTKDINHWTSRGAQRVLLRHGVGIKKVERAIDWPSHRLYKLFHGNPLQKLLWRFLLPWHVVRPDLLIATSPDHARQAEVYYAVEPERIVVTGFPRNDQLQRGVMENVDADVRVWLDESRELGMPVFLFLPTFRDHQTSQPFAWTKLNEIARRVGVRVLLKLHFVDDRRGVAKSLDNQSHVRLADASINPANLFGGVDALISDYSSAVYDFILTGKPLIFFVPDLDQYAGDRGLYYDFATVSPGPKARDMNELEAALREVAEQGLGQWADEYARIVDKFHTYRDDRSCERTYRAIFDRCVQADLASAALPENVLPQGREN